MKKLLQACLLLIFSGVNLFAQQKSRPNVLFIAVDDYEPIAGCYGNTQIKIPNIDRLAKIGTVFMNNYCQQAVCGPTRASLMTGKQPDYTKIWDLKTQMREMNPDIITLPQYLISQGYVTSSEHLDIFPTICDLTRIPVPTFLDGKSLKPIMVDNKAKVKDFSVSQYPRKLKK